MMRTPYIPLSEYSVEEAYNLLIQARNLLKSARCPKTLKRVRFAISSCKGARRNIRYRMNRTGDF